MDAAAAAAASTPSKQFWHLDFSQHKKIETATLDESAPLDEPWTAPSSDVAAKILGTNPCRLNLAVYKAGFAKKKPQPKRDHMLLESKSVRKDVINPLSAGNRILHFESGLGAATHLFAYSKERTSGTAAVYQI